MPTVYPLQNGMSPHLKIECPRYDTKLHLMMKFQFWSSESVEYPFIDITSRSTLSSSTSQRPIYKSNKSVGKLFV